MIADDLDRIEEVLNLSVTDLAYALGVKRQTIYNWRGGRPVLAENAECIRCLAAAADIFLGAEIQVQRHMLSRPIHDGKSFLHLVHAGEDAEDTARDLVAIVAAEAGQRAKLAARMDGRAPGDLSEAGIPHLDETAECSVTKIKARPLDEWTEEDGDVLWWKFPIEEPPYHGSPRDLGFTVEAMVTVRTFTSEEESPVFRQMVGGWPGYHTHWTPIEFPEEP